MLFTTKSVELSSLATCLTTTLSLMVGRHPLLLQLQLLNPLTMEAQANQEVITHQTMVEVV